MQELSLPQILAVSILPVLFAITVHEVAHGWVAKRFGDPTAQRLGRLTLNPLKHIDPVGTMLIPAVLLLLQGRFPVRLGQAGAGDLGEPAPPETRHGDRGRRRPGRQPADGAVWALIAKLGTLLPPDSATGSASRCSYMG